MPWTAETTLALIGCWDSGDPLIEGDEWCWDTRWWLAIVFDHLQRDARRTVLHALTASPDVEARRAAVTLIGRLRRDAHADVAILDDRLQSFTGDSDPVVRTRAETELRTAATMTKTAGGWLRGIHPGGSD